jgi:hypothetical protein
VPKPFIQRTWVRLVAVFIAGVFLMSMTWWVWEGLDKNRNQDEAAAKTAQQQQAIQVWKAALEPAMSGLGQLQGAVPPQIATTLAPAIDALAKGTDPGVTAKDMDALATQLDDAATTLERFKLSDAIKDHGFDAVEVDRITSAQTEIIAGLRSLRVAAELTALAISEPTGKAGRAALLDAAKQASDTGQDLIQRGWAKYGNVVAAAGIALGAPQGLPLGSGS